MTQYKEPTHGQPISSDAATWKNSVGFYPITSLSLIRFLPVQTRAFWERLPFRVDKIEKLVTFMFCSYLARFCLKVWDDFYAPLLSNFQLEKRFQKGLEIIFAFFLDLRNGPSTRLLRHDHRWSSSWSHRYGAAIGCCPTNMWELPRPVHWRERLWLCQFFIPSRHPTIHVPG